MINLFCKISIACLISIFFVSVPPLMLIAFCTTLYLVRNKDFVTPKSSPTYNSSSKHIATFYGENKYMRMDLFDNKITITKQGDQEIQSIPYGSIISIDVNLSNIGEDRGLIRLRIQGHLNIIITFFSENNESALHIRNLIEKQMNRLQSKNISEEVQMLAKLKEDGLLSDEEFNQAKKKLIG